MKMSTKITQSFHLDKKIKNNIVTVVIAACVQSENRQLNISEDNKTTLTNHLRSYII